MEFEFIRVFTVKIVIKKIGDAISDAITLPDAFVQVH